MKLDTEKALDLLPHIVDVYDKLNVDSYIKKTKAKNKGKKVEAELAGIDLFKYVMKNIGKAKEEIFEVVSILEEKTVAEVREQSIFETIKSIKAIFNDEELVELFKSAMQ